MESTPGKRLQEWREFKGLSLTEVFRLTGIKVTTLSTVEQPGGTNPSYDTLSKLLTAFPDLNPDWLLLGAGPMLRDGKALTSAPRAEAPRPIELSQDEQRRELVATAENVLLRQIIASKDELISELRGKPFDNPDAAGPFDSTPTPPAPRVAAGFRMAWMARRREQKRAAGLL